MLLAISVGIVILVLAVTGAFILIRRFQRQNMNIQRGLSMTLLQIHIPPYSEDKNDKNKDQRDIVEENISQANVLYNLLTSIAEKKSFKTNYYGQNHVGFEIVAKKDQVYFYASAPTGLVDMLRQAIMSTYKGARVEEVEEYNLFSPNINSQAIKGGTLILREHFAYPIATYVQTKQDIMHALLGALAELEHNSGVGVQFLLRPVNTAWTKKAQAVAKNIGKRGGSGNFMKDLFVSIVRPPDDSTKNDAPPKEISGLDKTAIEAIEHKVSQPGFEVLIRILVSTDNPMKSEGVYKNILASFKLLDSPKSNGFKPINIKDVSSFIKDFTLRLFPIHVNKSILNTTELATIFHIPNQSNIPTSQLSRQAFKQVDAPRDFLQEGLLLGHNVFRDQKRAIILGDEDRMRHVYVVGQTGTGKSVFLENMVLQDAINGKGFAFVDPHGESAEKILAQIPAHRQKDVVYFNPGNMDYPLGLNIFEFDTEDQQDFLIQEAIAILYALYDPQHQGIMGPRYEHMFRNAAKLIMADPDGGTFIDIPKLLNDRQFVEKKLKYVTDRTVLDFWQREIVDASKSTEFGDMKSWFISKFSAFLSNNMMRNIIGQSKSSFNLRQIMDEGKIMIINLSIGKTGELNMKLLGMLFVAKFQMSAMSRADMPAESRRDFTLYIDEFQNFATDSFAHILSAARKYRLALVVANQHTSQLTEDMRDSVYGNVGTAVSFRINASDAEDLIKQFYSPTFEVDDLTRLSLGNAVVRTLVNGTPTIPFNMVTLPPQITHNAEQRKAIEQQVLKTQGLSREEVEKSINKRLFASSEVGEGRQSSGSPFPANMPSAHNKNQPSAFMEEWLKRKQMSQQSDQLQHRKDQQYLKQQLQINKEIHAKIMSNRDSKPPQSTNQDNNPDMEA